MLAPDDRSVLLELLRPPAGMTLDAGIATTFTLDLEAALVAPLAFGSLVGSGPGDPIAALEAIRSVADRLTIFCQAGAVRVPATANDLFSFLEPMVFEVRRPPGFLFHPKLWLLRFASNDDVALRALVPTRNLTNDAGWDTVLALDAEVGRRIDSANEPLVDLAKWCLGATRRRVPQPRQQAIDRLLDGFKRATWDFPDGVTSMEFRALGIGHRTPIDFSGRRTLVISPFVNDDGLGIVAPTGDVTLVSRPDEMEKLTPDLVCQLADTICIGSIDPDTDIETNGDSGAVTQNVPLGLGDLHAKVIVVERAKQAIVFVGSANATAAAFGGNVEVLVELRGGVKRLGIDRLLTDMQPILEPYAVVGGRQPTEHDELQRALDNLLRSLAECQWKVTVAAVDDGQYHLAVTTPTPVLPSVFVGRATIELLTRTGIARRLKPGIAVAAEFDQVGLTDVTPFIAVRVELNGSTASVAGATVVRADLDGDPPGRLDAVLARQFDTPEKFLRFLLLVLGLGGGQVPPWLQPGSSGSVPANVSATPGRLAELGVFESMMRALADNPQALEDLGRLVERLSATDGGSSSLPEGFGVLWAAVSAARAQTSGVTS